MVYLVLFVEKCRDLKQVGYGRNAPFVKVQFAGTTHRTPTSKEGTDPNFRHHLMEWDVHTLDEHRLHQKIHVNVRHDGSMGATTIGITDIVLSRVNRSGGIQQRWFNIYDSSGREAGAVLITARLSDITETYRRHLENPVPHLWLTCHGGRDIRDSTTFTQQKPFLTLQVMGRKAKTHEAKNSETDPDWHDVVLRLPVGDGYDPTIPVHLGVDNKGKLSVTHLGSVTLQLNAFLRGLDHAWVPLSNGRGEICISGHVNDFKLRQRQQAHAIAAQAQAMAAQQSGRMLSERQALHSAASNPNLVLQTFYDLLRSCSSEKQELKAISDFSEWMVSHRTAAATIPRKTLQQIIPAGSGRRLTRAIAEAYEHLLQQHMAFQGTALYGALVTQASTRAAIGVAPAVAGAGAGGAGAGSGAVAPPRVPSHKSHGAPSARALPEPQPSPAAAARPAPLKAEWTGSVSVKFNSAGRGVMQLPGNVRAVAVLQTPPLPTSPPVASIEVAVVGQNQGHERTTGGSCVQLVVLDNKTKGRILYRALVANVQTQRMRFRRTFTLDPVAQQHFSGNSVAVLACTSTGACHVEAVTLTVNF